MAKTGPTDYRTTVLADDEEFEDFYRPEKPLKPRAGSRASSRTSRQDSSRQDFADAGPRGRKTRDREQLYEQQLTDEDDDFLPDEEDRSFLRSRRRVPVRRNALLSTKWGRIALGLGLLVVLGVLAAIFMLVRNFFLEDPRFRIETASSIQILGNSEISRNELLTVFGSDVGHDIFTVPLAARRAALQKLPWVQHATVMRLLPNQLRISIVERIPAAFVRVGSKIQLVDATGVLLDMPPAMLATKHYSFPVVVGINASDPAETRAERMQQYEAFVSAIDSVGPATGPKPSQQLSEVDVSDPEDVRAMMPSAGADILVHFGDDDFANRYQTYQQHLKEWRQQYPHLAAIDLRYDRQTVLEMDKSAGTNPANAIDSAPVLTATPTTRPAAAKHLVSKPIAKKKVVAKKSSRPVKAASKPPSRAVKGRDY